MLKFNVVWRTIVSAIAISLALAYMHTGYMWAAILWAVSAIFWSLNAAVTAYGNGLNKMENIYYG
jgi:mannose/fructose/N-acetylgalactosamine-specific phosphotransferase system component IID